MPKRENPEKKPSLDFTFDPPVNGIKRAKVTGSRNTRKSRYIFNVSLYSEGHGGESAITLKKTLTQSSHVNLANPESWDGAVHAGRFKRNAPDPGDLPILLL